MLFSFSPLYNLDRVRESLETNRLISVFEDEKEQIA